MYQKIDVRLYNGEYSAYEEGEELEEGAVIIHDILEPCSFNLIADDFVDGEFDLDKWTERTGITSVKIALLKEKLQKYKEDVEQVDLFNMIRDDYQEKKRECAKIIIELRKLEGKVN